MCAQFVKMEINYRHVLSIIVVERTIYFIYFIILLYNIERSKMNVTVYQHNKDFIFLTAPQKGITWCEVW